MISYYELLGMIKEDKAPKKIRVHLTQMTSKIYTRENDLDDTFNCYVIDEGTSEDYKYYLAECFLESSMFDKNIEIIEEEKKIPEKLKIEDDGNTITLYGEKENEWTILDNVDVIVCNKINSIIDYLQSKGE